MSNTGSSIFANAMPGPGMKINGPGDTLRKIAESIKPKVAKQTFGLAGDAFEISLVGFAGGVQRLKLAAVTPGVSGSYDHSFLNVDEMVFWFQGDRKPFGPTTATHHIQSANFQFDLVRERTKGVHAAKTNAAKLLALLEKHGAEFLDSIDDPNFASDAAVALLGARTKLANPKKSFGPSAIEPDLSPDAIAASDAFRVHAEGKIIVDRVEVSPKGIFQTR